MSEVCLIACYSRSTGTVKSTYVHVSNTFQSALPVSHVKVDFSSTKKTTEAFIFSPRNDQTFLAVSRDHVQYHLFYCSSVEVKLQLTAIMTRLSLFGKRMRFSNILSEQCHTFIICFLFVMTVTKHISFTYRLDFLSSQ